METKPETLPVIQVRNLTKTFHDETIIRDFSFDLQRGERLLLFAPSGAGKTTLMRILSGLLQTDSGSFSFPHGDIPQIVFQEPRLFPHLTVDENIRLPLKSKFFQNRPNGLQYLDEWYELSQLEGYQKAYPYTLSGGMKRKVSLLRALITLPSLLLLDEPFQSLDKASREIFVQSIFNKIPHLSILFSSHDILDVEICATLIILIKSPKLQNPIIMSSAEFVKAFTN